MGKKLQLIHWKAKFTSEGKLLELNSTNGWFRITRLANVFVLAMAGSNRMEILRGWGAAMLAADAMQGEIES